MAWSNNPEPRTSIAKPLEAATGKLKNWQNVQFWSFWPGQDVPAAVCYLLSHHPQEEELVQRFITSHGYKVIDREAMRSPDTCAVFACSLQLRNGDSCSNLAIQFGGSRCCCMSSYSQELDSQLPVSEAPKFTTFGWPLRCPSGATTHRGLVWSWMMAVRVQKRVFPKIGVPQKMDGLEWKTLLKWMIWG